MCVRVASACQGSGCSEWDGAQPRDYREAFRGLPLGPRVLALSARYAPWFTYQIRRRQVKVITGEPSVAPRLFSSCQRWTARFWTAPVWET